MQDDAQLVHAKFTQEFLDAARVKAFGICAAHQKRGPDMLSTLISADLKKSRHQKLACKAGKSVQQLIFAVTVNDHLETPLPDHESSYSFWHAFLEIAG